MDPSLFLTKSLREHASGAAIARVMAAGLEAVDPYTAVHRFLKREDARLEIGGQDYDLDRFPLIWVLGAGKAAYPMALAASEILAGRITGGLVITKDGHTPVLSLPGGIQIRETGHPVPDERGVRAAQEMAAILQDTTAQDLVICLISGGGPP